MDRRDHTDRRNRSMLLMGALLCAVLFLTGAVVPLADDADATFLGEDFVDYAGRSVTMAGDVNGDGYDDFLIGAYNASYDGLRSGVAYLLLGRPEANWGTGFELSSADASFVGETASDYAGRLVSRAGDVNGDGYDDFLIGADHYDTSPVLTETGKVYLILGRRAADWGTGFSLTDADASFVGEAVEDKLGESIASAGDVNGDGCDDFLLAAYLNDEGGPRAGKVYLILGRPEANWGQTVTVTQADASFVGFNSYNYAGRSVAGVGDVNGDGRDDFLIGAYGAYNNGRAYLFLGRDEANWEQSCSMADADATFWGEASLDRAGYTVAGAGDVNGDGLDDFTIGAYKNDEGGETAGKVYLVFGRTVMDWFNPFNLGGADASFRGSHIDDQAGSSLAGAGDVNRDGYDDFLIGAKGYDSTDVLTDTGRAYLVFGRAKGWQTQVDLDAAATSGAVLALNGEGEMDKASEGLAGDGDVNGDGLADIIVGSQWNDDNEIAAGKSYLVLGRGLVVDKSPSAWAVDPGETITYSLSYKNTENSAVDEVRIGDLIPTDMSYAGCTGGTTCMRQGQRVIWYVGTVAPGASGVVQMTAQVPSDAIEGAVITNTAWITASSRLNAVFSSVTTRVGRFEVYLPLVLR